MKESVIKLLKSLFARMNRGILLDFCIFILNVFLLSLLTRNFVELTVSPDEDIWAKSTVALFFTGLLFLAPLGAILKRDQFWDRIEDQNKKGQVTKNIRIFIFSPWISFIWLLIIYAFAVVSWHPVLLRDSYLSSTWAILAIFFGGMIYCFLGAVAISDFFRHDAGAPRWKIHRNGMYADEFFDFLYDAVFDRFGNFLQTRFAAALGDLFILLNMICFQIFWGYLFSNLYDVEYKDSGEIVLTFLSYLLLVFLFYFPARNFYLAEDIHRPIVWFTIFLANLPTLLYYLFRVRIF